jgi:hypothetical protein
MDHWMDNEKLFYNDDEEGTLENIEKDDKFFSP